LADNKQAVTGEELHQLAEMTLEQSLDMKIEADEEGDYGEVKLV